MSINIKRSEEAGIDYPFMTCPHCQHNFTTWQTTLSGGFIEQTGFIDSFYSTTLEEDIYTEGNEGMEMNGDWTASHYCENCRNDITSFIEESFDEE